MEDNVNGEKLSLWKRIYGVIWGSPAGTLESIARKPDFWGAVALILGFNLALTLVQMPKIREFTAWTMQNLPPEVKMTAQQMDVAVNAALIAALAASVALPPVLWLVTAALLKLFNAFTGEKASFRSLFAVTVYAYLPAVLDAVIKTALVLATPARNIARVTISPALLLPPPDMVPDRMYTLLSHLDPFVVWLLVLTAVGGSAAMRIPFRRTFAYIIVLWLAYVAGVSLIFGKGAV
ncbi:MAG: YIP1 family protein [Peptococcaceae bacterium]|nr:YIP1 family protein [Peptococcaceae bacterium]